MKKNIFQQINEIVKTKFFKIIVAVVILGIVFYMNFDVKRIDKDKLSNFIKKDKTISKNITDIIDASHETMVQPKESENTTVKKQLIPDSLIKKDIKKEEKLKTITNVFLKLKKIEDNYQRRVENNQINKDRKVKYGDYIYYSNKAMFLDDNNKDNEIRFYTLIEKGDPISDNLIGKKVGDFVSHTVFQLPTKMGKGVLITPTVHGNLLVGPTAEDIQDKEGVNTTAQGLEKVASQARLSAGEVPLRMVITSFAGLRATEKGEDFVLGEAPDAPGFFNAAGIESPGLSSAPAIGEYLAEMIAEKLQAKKKENFIARREDIPCVAESSPEEIQALIAKDPAYGNVICRCETVTEGEIVNAIRRPLGARSLDGVKRRTRAGMGRCQAGFCSPRTMEILARELKESPLALTKAGGNSKLLVGEK